MRKEKTLTKRYGQRKGSGMTQYILSIDQGTSSSRAILFDQAMHVVHLAQEEFPQYFPQDGWVEHEPEEIWQSVLRTCKEVLGQISGDDSVLAIGITNQRETTVLWDRVTGEPLHKAIVWQDRRTSQYCADLRQRGLEQMVRDKTGLLLDPYFSATKLKWLLDNVPGARTRAEAGELAFGTIDTYVLWKLTNGTVHRTDATNASRTMMFNIHEQVWDQDLLALFEIPPSVLPEVMDCAAEFGVSSAEMLGMEIPVRGMVGDQQGALVGQACFHEGMAKSTYGTGCFMIANTGDHALQSSHRLLTTVGYRLNGKTTYALEGSIFIAGAAVQWLRDGLKIIKNAGESEALAKQIDHKHGVYMVPAFTGLGAPYWDADARGGIFGLTRDTGIAEIVSATLQSVCYQTKDLQRAMQADGQRPNALRVDGGMVANDWLMQFLADMLGSPVERPIVTETTALGAAYLAALQSGVFASLGEIESLWQCERRFDAVMSKRERDTLYHGWENAVARVRAS